MFLTMPHSNDTLTKVVTKCVMNLAWKSVPGNQCGSLAWIVQLLHCGQGFLQRCLATWWDICYCWKGSEDCHTRVLPRRSRNKAAYCFQLPALRRISHQSAQVLLFLVNSAGSIHQIGSTGSTWGVNHFSKVEAGSVFSSHSLQRISPGRPLQSSLSPGMIDDLTIFDHLKHVWAILASNDSGYFLLFLLDWVNRKRDFSFPGFGKWNRVEFYQHIYDGKESKLFAGVSEHWKLKTQVFLSVDLWGLRIQARKMPTPNKIKQAILLSTSFPDLVCKKAFKF